MSSPQSYQELVYVENNLDEIYIGKGGNVSEKMFLTGFSMKMSWKYFF